MPKMTSLLRNIADRFTPNASSTDLCATKARPDGFRTAKAPDALFPRTKAEVDGEECLHDCDSCTAHLPRGFKIDEEDKLFGEIKGFSRHLIVATGKTDWVRDVADEKGSVMEAIGQHDNDVEGGRLMLSASNMILPDDDDGRRSGPYGRDRPTTVLLMPAFQFIDNVTPNLVPDLIQSVINSAPTNTTSLSSSASSSSSSTTPPSSNLTNGNHRPPTSSSNSNNNNADQPSYIPRPTLQATDLPTPLSLRNCPHKYIILMCSQATRDARCGQSAPLLRRELERHLRPLGLYRDLGDERPGGVGIYFISHVGGHKYSANMMIYRRPGGASGAMMNGEREAGSGLVGGGKAKVVDGEAAQCIWLARVRPEDCENIVRFTVLQGKVVKPERQLRGGFDREKGVVSW